MSGLAASHACELASFHVASELRSLEQYTADNIDTSSTPEAFINGFARVLPTYQAYLRQHAAVIQARADAAELANSSPEAMRVEHVTAESQRRDVLDARSAQYVKELAALRTRYLAEEYRMLAEFAVHSQTLAKATQ